MYVAKNVARIIQLSSERSGDTREATSVKRLATSVAEEASSSAEDLLHFANYFVGTSTKTAFHSIDRSRTSGPIVP